MDLKWGVKSGDQKELSSEKSSKMEEIFSSPGEYSKFLQGIEMHWCFKFHMYEREKKRCLETADSYMLFL